MPEITAHPSREQLSAYNLGQLPPDEAVAVENHISECEPCCDTIISLSSDDTFVGLLKEARQLPTDQTADHDMATASSSCQDIAVPLAEHPRYEILGLIGKGGMGDVYKARHRKMERTVALKVINRELVQKLEAVDRFHREVKAAAQLSHPNIVTAHDADQAGDFHFMVMEYVDGVDLSQTVKDRGALPVAEACDYVRQAAIGLQHAHECGMVHRDIKPHNLMVTSDGTVKILDFGLASLAPEAKADTDAVEARGDLTAAGALMGTPDFISPEQADDARKADIRSDIYSLGATLYFLLAGHPPFAEGSLTQKLKSHAQAEPKPLKSLRDDVPNELVAVVTKMTAKDPEERYLTPAEVAAALESFLRTWQPGEAASLEQEPSSGGNISGSGGQKPVADDMSPNWLSAWAKWLFYISLIPIAVLVLDVFFLSEDASTAAADRLLYYLLASVCLSSIAGVLTGIHQFKTSTRDDHRSFRLTAGQTLLIAAILFGAAAYFFIPAINGVLHVEVKPPGGTTALGTHPLTIVDTSGKKPAGGTSGTRQDDAAGVTTHFFESANGRYKIELSNEVLTVNGDKYTLENPNDSIRIVDDRVEITRVEVRSKDGEPIDAQPLSKAEKTQQILDRMEKTYAECKSYRDSGVIEAVVRESPNSPNVLKHYSFTTSFVRPDQFRFEIKDEDENSLLISASEEHVRTWWDIEPGIQEPESLELAFAQALGFAGSNVGHIPALLMPRTLEAWSSLQIVDPKQREDEVFEDVDCFRLEFNFSKEKTTLWIDKHTYLVRRIEQLIKTDSIYAEWRTTFKPTINGKVTEKMLEFDPPMKPHKASEAAEAEADMAPAGGRSASSNDFEREAAKWVLGIGGVVVLKNTAGRFEKVENVDDLPARQFTITHIGMNSAKTLADEDLKRLEGLHLRTLTLSGTQVTDGGLAYLQRVPQLDYLVLNQCPRISLSDVSGLRHVEALSLRASPAISDGALKALEGLPSLSQLDVGENRQLTDQGLTHTAKLNKLTLLALDSTDISDAGLKHLAPLDGLYTLNLSSTAITDAGLQHLSALDALFDLNLASTAISDEGLKHLAPLDLYALNLDSTAISDAGLKHLASHEGLRKLSLVGTVVTAQGVEELRNSLSEECQIDWELRADDGERTDEKVESAAQLHFRALLELDEGSLAKSYAPVVQLMPGHEFLKDQYGLTEPGGRAIGAQIAREKLVEVLVKYPVDPAKKVAIEKMLPAVKFEKLAVAEGEFVIVADPTDPVESPDGKLHFTIAKGDVLIKIVPPRGDYALLQMRHEDGTWQVVSEYLD